MADPYDIAAGEALARLRRLRGMSQTDVARASGVTYPQIQKYESGANRMSVSRMVRIAAALDMTLVAFVAEFAPLPDGAAIPDENLAALKALADAGREVDERLAALRADMADHFAAVRQMLEGAGRRQVLQEAAQ